jgi:hypothetical protein
MGVEKRARATLVCALMVALGAASPAIAHADTPCKQWRFDGYTEFDLSDGGKFTFIFYGADIPFNQPTLVRSIPPNGGPFAWDEVNGYVDGNNHVEMFAKQLVFIGGVTDDGFAYGIVGRGNTSTASWRSAAPLRCADNGG